MRSFQDELKRIRWNGEVRNDLNYQMKIDCLFIFKSRSSFKEINVHWSSVIWKVLMTWKWEKRSDQSVLIVDVHSWTINVNFSRSSSVRSMNEKIFYLSFPFFSFVWQLLSSNELSIQSIVFFTLTPFIDNHHFLFLSKLIFDKAVYFKIKFNQVNKKRLFMPIRFVSFLYQKKKEFD